MMNRVQGRPIQSNNVVELSLQDRANPNIMLEEIMKNPWNLNRVSPSLWENYSFPFDVLYSFLSKANNMENKELALRELRECLRLLKEVSGVDVNVINTQQGTFKVIRNDKPKNNKTVYENVSYTESSEYSTTKGRPKNETKVKSILTGSRWNNAA